MQIKLITIRDIIPISFLTSCADNVMVDYPLFKSIFKLLLCVSSYVLFSLVLMNTPILWSKFMLFSPYIWKLRCRVANTNILALSMMTIGKANCSG